jgi:flagellar hook assembly protein FlgD
LEGRHRARGTIGRAADLDLEPRLRKVAFVLAAVALAAIGALAPATAPNVSASVEPKVAIIVGATHSATSTYRTYANQLYAEAINYTSNVVKVYSPHATWSKVKSAVNGASVIVYLGHGNGWPSPYTYDPKFTTKDGFGLNYDLNGDGKLSDYENKYYGEPKIETLTPAPNAVVLLFHLCYASGNSEPGNAEPSLSVARQRVDNYASAFLRAGARAVIADGHSHDPYYIRALFTTRQTIEDYWRNAPDFHDHVLPYGSFRSPGYSYLMDPESSSPSRFYRSIAGNMSLTTEQVTGASYASTSGDPSSLVIPGNATPTADGTPVFGSVDGAVAGTDSVATLAASDVVRVDDREAASALDGSPIVAMHTDGGVDGFMPGSSLVPRDSTAPRLWEVDDGTGAFSPNGDGSRDTFPLALTLSEAASWTIRIRDGGGAVLTSASGTGGTASLTWKPAAGSVPDGTYTWTLTATDGWGNGPLESSGRIVVDTQAPSVTVADAETASPPLFTPNGDGWRDSVGFAVASDEPGTIVGAARNASGTTVATVSTPVGSTGTTLTWDGRKSNGAYASDGSYALDIVAQDRAGNSSAAQTRDVLVFGAMGFVATSTNLFFPQDGDSLASKATLSFVLRSGATITWTVTNSSGDVVCTIKDGQALAAGTYTFAWNGRNDAGAYVPRGVYRSVVRATGAGDLAVSQTAAVRADAFRITTSDTTPRRGQKVTFKVTSAEPLSSSVKLRVYQPGIRSWYVTMTRVSGRTYKATIRYRSSATGTVVIKVIARDSHGATQWSRLKLRLH